MAQIKEPYNGANMTHLEHAGEIVQKLIVSVNETLFLVFVGAIKVLSGYSYSQTIFPLKYIERQNNVLTLRWSKPLRP